MAAQEAQLAADQALGVLADSLVGVVAQQLLPKADGKGRVAAHEILVANHAVAALIRDGGCTFPGCDRPVGWLDIHHVLDWDHDGPTDIANLAALCRSHHGVTHPKGWSMTGTADGWFWWQTPSGHTFWSQRHGHQRAGPAPPPFGLSAAA